MGALGFKEGPGQEGGDVFPGQHGGRGSPGVPGPPRIHRGNENESQEIIFIIFILLIYFLFYCVLNIFICSGHGNVYFQKRGWEVGQVRHLVHESNDTSLRRISTRRKAG